MKIHVIGSGAWGTAVYHLLKRNGHTVTHFKGRDTSSPGWAKGLDFVVLAVPSRFLMDTLKRWKAPKCPVISTVKGIEPIGFKRVSEMVGEVWKNCPFTVLSGPSFAAEVEREIPTAVVVASQDAPTCRAVQELFHRPEFRVYRSEDVCGVEIGGALKNVYAIAAGVCSGLTLGDNSLAALVTRALAEMSRVGVALGGRLETFMGLSGVGDLMLTCYGAKSRNRQFGMLLCAGGMIAAEAINGVAEGVTTIKAVRELVLAKNIEAPVAMEIYDLIYGNKLPKQALMNLLGRDMKEEMAGK